MGITQEIVYDVECDGEGDFFVLSEQTETVERDAQGAEESALSNGWTKEADGRLFCESCSKIRAETAAE